MGGFHDAIGNPLGEKPNGTNESAVLFGDPGKPGPYVQRLKWLPGNMSRPHFHQNDRFFVLISGTWWMGTGEKFDPDSTVPVPAGSYVIHRAKGTHYDGAKDQEAIIQVWDMGPATSTPAEKKRATRRSPPIGGCALQRNDDAAVLDGSGVHQ
jgi:hypothetical protein